MDRSESQVGERGRFVDASVPREYGSGSSWGVVEESWGMNCPSRGRWGGQECRNPHWVVWDRAQLCSWMVLIGTENGPRLMNTMSRGPRQGGEWGIMSLHWPLAWLILDPFPSPIPFYPSYTLYLQCSECLSSCVSGPLCTLCLQCSESLSSCVAPLSPRLYKHL